MIFILLLNFVPILGFVIIVTAYKTAIKELRRQEVDIPQAAVKRIRNRHILYSIVVLVIAITMNLFLFCYSINKTAAP